LTASVLVRHDHGLRQSDRKPYFSAIPATGDLFLDPDIGIKTGGRNRTEEYLLPTELLADGCYQRALGCRLSALPDGNAPQSENRIGKVEGAGTILMDII
jgi:hypothetical protein